MVCSDSAALNSGATLAVAPQHISWRRSRAAGSYIHQIMPFPVGVRTDLRAYVSTILSLAPY